MEAGDFYAGKDRHTVYFTATFDRPFTPHGTWRATTPAPSERNAAGEGGNGAWVTFEAGSDRDVVVRVGLFPRVPRVAARTSKRRGTAPTHRGTLRTPASSRHAASGTAGGTGAVRACSVSPRLIERSLVLPLRRCSSIS
ncbi:hypothetical protein ACHBTE_15560 [Streptomyces sp. M41]|uniref:hypothetical protein n=1 Tax=Streptomyces sp. M41 TaxID=3059412 RepID=UPI00374DE787